MWDYHCDVVTWWENICSGGFKASNSSPEVVYNSKITHFRSDSTDSEESPIQHKLIGRRWDVRSDQYYRNLHNEFIESILFEELEQTGPKERQRDLTQTAKKKGDDINNTIGEPSEALERSSTSIRSLQTSDDGEDSVLTPTGRRNNSKSILSGSVYSSKKSKRRIFLRRPNPPLPHHPTGAPLSSSTRSMRSGADLRLSSREKTSNPRLKTNLNSTPPKDSMEKRITDNISPSIVRPVSKRKIKNGESSEKTVTGVSSEALDIIPSVKPSTYYLTDNVLFYKDRSPNPIESFYVFDPTDNAHFSVVQGKSAALGKLRDKTSFLSNQATSGSSDSADEVSPNGSLNDAPRLVRASSSQGKGYNIKRTPSGVSSFIGHDVNSISVNQGFLPGGLVETRSILKIKIGFLRMNYGILLRWNRKGKITVIALKKNTSSAFLNEIPFVRRLPDQDQPVPVQKLPGIASFFKTCSPVLCEGIQTDSFDDNLIKPLSQGMNSFRLDMVEPHTNGSCTVVKCYADGTSEITLLTAPFLAPKPDLLFKRQPLLQVRVLSATLPLGKATGGIESATPFVKLTLGHSHHKIYMGRRKLTAHNDDMMTWNFDKANTVTFSVSSRHSSLLVELSDSSWKKHAQLGSLGFGRVLLSELEACNTNNASPSPVKVMLYSDTDFQKITDGSIAVEILYVNLLACWVMEEFQARQNANKNM
jgi:hypothetical protein